VISAKARGVYNNVRKPSIDRAEEQRLRRDEKLARRCAKN
jgi:hypothetical protein